MDSGIKHIVILIAIAILLALPNSAQSTGVDTLYIDVNSLDGIKMACSTTTHWRFHPGDNIEWANPEFDDTDWIGSKTFVDYGTHKQEGIYNFGWYRLHLNVDSTLWNKTISLRYAVIGAFDLYLNGTLVVSKGIVGKSEKDEKTYYKSEFIDRIYLTLDSYKDQVLAVRFSAHNKSLIQNYQIAFGFVLIGEALSNDEPVVNENFSRVVKHQMFFTGVSLAFALLHFLVFLLYKRDRKNLYFSLFTLSCALLAYAPFEMGLVLDLDSFLRMLFIFKLAMIGCTIFAIRIMYSIYYDKAPAFFKYIALTGILSIIFHSFLNIMIFYVIVMAFFLELIRIIIKTIYEKKKFAWVIGLGFAMFLLFSGYQMMAEFFDLPLTGLILQPYLVGILLLMISISLYLAYTIAWTNINLEQKLVEVQKLSDRTIEQEVARKLLQKDIENKEKQLQEAARLEQAMRELESAHSQLKLADRRLQTIMDASPVPLIVSRLDNGTILYANKQLGHLVGYTAEELEGSGSPEFYYNKEDRKVVVDMLERDGLVDNHEVRIKCRDGRAIWCLFSLVMTQIDDNKVIIGGLYDISERKEAEEKLQEANIELKQTQAQLVQSEKMASLGQLVAGVAHEINNPMGAIKSIHNTQVKAIDKLKKVLGRLSEIEQNDKENLEKYLKVVDNANNIITKGSDRVTEIVRRLKSFARLDEAELQKADINECIEDTLTLMHHEIKYDISVNKWCEELPLIACYPGQLNQVFLNLLINAKQALEGKKDKGEIQISTSYIDKRVLITIEDNGEGISPENLKRIFDPGFTTKGAGVGTGLGLSICYQIIKEHKGEIKVQSKEGYGTIFVIDLPSNLDELLKK